MKWWGNRQINQFIADFVLEKKSLNSLNTKSLNKKIKKFKLNGLNTLPLNSSISKMGKGDEKLSQFNISTLKDDFSHPFRIETTFL